MIGDSPERPDFTSTALLMSSFTAAKTQEWHRTRRRYQGFHFLRPLIGSFRAVSSPNFLNTLWSTTRLKLTRRRDLRKERLDKLEEIKALQENADVERW